MKQNIKKKSIDELPDLQQSDNGITKAEKDLAIILKILQRQHENEALRKLLDNLDYTLKSDQQKQKNPKQNQ